MINLNGGPGKLSGFLRENDICGAAELLIIKGSLLQSPDLGSNSPSASTYNS